MRRLFPLLLLLVCACRSEAASESEPQTSNVEAPCHDKLFEQSRFTVCSLVDGEVQVRTADANGQPYRSFTALEDALGEKADQVAFAMNAGMFDEDGNAIGLLIEEGKEVHAINRREGSGNFHLQPNGVFLVRRDGSSAVVESEEFKPADTIAFATQSGPMLLIDGKMHPRFDQDGESRHFRNGVGIGSDGTPLFTISEEPVSFGKFARFYRDALGVKNALYFDGAVSSLWDPANDRRDLNAPLGPMVVVFRSGE